MKNASPEHKKTPQIYPLDNASDGKTFTTTTVNATSAIWEIKKEMGPRQ